MQMHDGGISSYFRQAYTKEDLLALIEKNFPDNETMEIVAVILTTESNQGKFQSVTFGKILE